MYKIVLTQNTTANAYTLHNPLSNDLLLINPKLTLTLNKTGTLTFSVAVNHPYYDKIEKMKCEITVYQNNQILYIGRILNMEKDFYQTMSVTCEGILSYLLDSIQRPYEYRGNIHGFFSGLITNHNNAIPDSYKQFEAGICDVADSNNYINRSDSNYTNTLNTIHEKLIQTHGGYLSVRYENNRRYIDYKAQSGTQNRQIIRFSENLLDLTQYIKADSLITAIIPLGAETEEKGINDTNKRVTIESVNDNKDYLIDTVACEQFGTIYGTVEFDDVTLPLNLKTKAQQYLNSNKNLSLTIELSAVDLSVLKADIESFRLGDYVRVISRLHNLDSYFLITEYETDLVDPSKNKIVLGKTLSRLSSTVNQNQNDITINLIKKTNALNSDIENAVTNATNLITGSTGGYLYIKKNNDGQPEELYILDTPSVDDAENVFRLNKNGFGFSSTGYNGSFRNAWTIDGSLVADFITSGTLNAEIIKAGKLQDRNQNTTFDLDTGTLTIKKGSINISNGNFSVDSSGYLTSKSGTIGGFTIGANSISNDVISLQSDGMWLNRTDTQVGKIGTNNFSGYSDYKGLSFDLEYDGSFMMWARKMSADADTYTAVLTYARVGAGFTNEGLYLGCNLYATGKEINSANLTDVRTDNYATFNGQKTFITGITSNPDGTINWTSETFTIKNGMFIN
ncbi:MAG: phage tail protein [Clostridia bacterium]|nr:phage tail protein [Clostridia bacterium]